MKGPKERYAEITPEIEERIDFELNTIREFRLPGVLLNCGGFYSRSPKYGCFGRAR